jgi:tetratricopeptide (TPR) repeat protein/sRNA-binding regulator protein Hfq
MSVYYRESGLTWKQYLQADSFVQDITGQVKRSGEGMKMAISDQTRSIVASNDVLAREFGAGFDSVNSTLEWGLGKVSGELAELREGVTSTLEWGFGRVTSEIAELRAEFTYGMGLVLEQLRIQQRTLEDILDQLDAIHETLKHPLLTQARELSKIGMERTSKGLLQEGLEALLESAEKNKTDFLVQFHIGKLYLYGRNATDDVINLPKAEEHLCLAARYANSEIRHLPDASKFCGEAFLHAAVSCYAQANEKWLAKDVDAAKRFTEQALELSQNATKVYPQLSEAFYHHAKFAALLGDGQTAQNSLKTAILSDRNYCIKADADKDFDGVRNYVYQLFEELRQQAKTEAIRAFESVKKLLEDWVYQTPADKQAEAEIRKLFGQAETLYRSKDTYFDYLDVLSLLKEAQQHFDRVPLFCEITTLTGHSVSFSPDGKYLASVSNDKTVKVYLVDGFQEIATLTEYSVSFSPDGKYLASVSNDKTVKVYLVDGFQEIATLTGDLFHGSSISFSPDGKYLASGSADKTVKVYRMDGFQEVATLTGHSEWVSSVSFSPNGKYLASGSGDKTVKVYRVEGFQEVATLTRHSGSVSSVSFSPDGKYLASGGWDKTVKVWGKEVISRQEFEEQERRRIKEIEAVKETERRRKEEEERRKREAEEADHRRREQEIREYRLRNKLCLECGATLGFWGVYSRKQYCKRHRT